MSEWLRERTTVYELGEAGYRKGEPVMVNRWWANVQTAGPVAVTAEELDRITRTIQAAPDGVALARLVLLTEVAAPELVEAARAILAKAEG